jgi:putative tricarboxylic transport membrane protein
MRTGKAGALILLTFSIAYGLLAFKVPLTFLAQRETFNARTMPLKMPSGVWIGLVSVF